eukprot:CAMPEP_0204219438 /NCGR_PEP_ID=MMETSP0361-20130328/80303_1 /ASSEMBLY_ACC=CAM_ASM_000343 /TAXON_ID=268821 /ORGANISM="Scrippsiella Hangoei, Strain SHTV-5" /LENGTH=58 /DNA_ID=CAMNT_0051184725 /DNA_START=17 /DNA_END=191 /DNA_ORIENTATION=+
MSAEILLGMHETELGMGLCEDEQFEELENEVKYIFQVRTVAATAHLSAMRVCLAASAR